MTAMPPHALAPRAALPRVWHFASAVVNERTLELTVDGSRVPLERKPLEVLIFLLQRAGTVVTKEDLAQALWPGRGVTDSNLTKCIAVVRVALVDRDHEIIKTVHGYGYRVAIPVFVERDAPAESEAWLGTAAMLAAGAGSSPDRAPGQGNA